VRASALAAWLLTAWDSWQDPVFIESVALGTSAPRLSNARILPPPQDHIGPPDIQFDAEYTDDAVSVRLTTSLFFNQPVPAFARLPVSLSLTLDAFRATLTVSPPDPADLHPSMTVKLHPEFTLSLQASSLLGSRAKLANVPKVHELIENRIRKALIDRGTIRVRIPGHAERPG
jgi:maintenance of morphology protein 1